MFYLACFNQIQMYLQAFVRQKIPFFTVTYASKLYFPVTFHCPGMPPKQPLVLLLWAHSMERGHIMAHWPHQPWINSQTQISSLNSIEKSLIKFILINDSTIACYFMPNWFRASTWYVSISWPISINITWNKIKKIK